MYEIVDKQQFSANVVKFEVKAPRIAAARRPGHFVIVINDAHGERIPLTIADANIERGTITIVVQAIGDSTRAICSMEPGQRFADIVGPLGRATRIPDGGTVVCCGGGV
ncbi:MAG: sulfide/dihydroorotate dehydrogenase-like FAD/NAD-binding protein, partial [Muribaculaceae bacterium]|nr:sulfide/dihydroorotate dehydrogenase-like FAD/NAD-binding protein [Muribaculaceae bacterium]